MTQRPDISSLCAVGMYSLLGWAECVACPAGLACPSVFGEAIVTCAVGTYSLEKSIVSLVN